MHRFDWQSARQAGKLVWLIMPLMAVILWLTLGMGALIFPNLLISSVTAENAARQLLHICRLWYVVLALVLLAGFPIILWAGWFASRKLGGAGPGKITLVCLMFPCLCILAVLKYGGLPDRFFQAGRDLAEIESGFLVQAEVWISPKIHPAPLPGPYSNELAETITRCGIIGEDTGNSWVTVYVPTAMGFSLDQDRLFDENQSFGWNWEHAQRYRIRYTSNFHFVTELIPIE